MQRMCAKLGTTIRPFGRLTWLLLPAGAALAACTSDNGSEAPGAASSGGGSAGKGGSDTTGASGQGGAGGEAVSAGGQSSAGGEAGSGVVVAPCQRDQRVADGACVACPAGTQSEAGADPDGPDTECDAVLCDEDEHVSDHECEACPPGTGNSSGDDASAGDTACSPILCETDEHVVNHACVPCSVITQNDAGDDASGDDTDCEIKYNYAFVSPVAVGADMGELGGADALCDGWAADAGLPGTMGSYRAILSTSSVHASSRLAGARGWIRPDGRPVADSPVTLFDGSGPLAAIRLDPSGTDLGQKYVWSASTQDGSYNSSVSGTDCGGWDTADTAEAWYGFSDATSEWLNRGTLSACDQLLHVYCFQVDHDTPLDVSDFAETGRRIFVSTGNFDVTSGIEGADQLCSDDVTATEGLDGTFKALLADDGASAASRFAASDELIVRLDGLRVADNLAALSTDDLVHPANLRPNGAYYTFRVFTGTGSMTPEQPGTNATTCDGWTLTTGTFGVGMGAHTSLLAAERRWFGYGTDSCATRTGTLPVYCLEEP